MLQGVLNNGRESCISLFKRNGRNIFNSNYKKLAQKYKISNSSIEMMKTAFSLKEYS